MTASGERKRSMRVRDCDARQQLERTTLTLRELDESIEAFLGNGRDSLSASADGGDGGRREVVLNILDVDLPSKRVN
jgi:hypothetical protein